MTPPHRPLRHSHEIGWRLPTVQVNDPAGRHVREGSESRSGETLFTVVRFDYHRRKFETYLEDIG